MINRPMLFSVPVDPLTFGESVERCVELVESRGFVQHVVLNAGKVVLMADDPQIHAIVADCDMVNADGQSVVWAGKILGVRFPERVTGIDLMEALLAEAADRGWPVYLLGARPEVLIRFTEVLHTRHPALVIAGHHDGYFDDDAAVVQSIAESGARLLLVAMPSPRKELFLAAQREQLSGIFCMGVGGSFDVWAGVTTRAPRWMQRSGLEWVYRLIQEPTRMWRRYLIGNFRYLGIVIRELLTTRRRDEA